MKTCTKCKVEQPLTKFSKNKRKKDGFDIYCKACCKQYREDNKDSLTEQKKQYYKENKKRISEYKKQYIKANKERIDEYHKQYREANKERFVERDKQYYKRNKERIDERSAKYQKNNKESISNQRRQHYKKNKDRIAEYNAQYNENNKDRIADQQRQYREANKDSIADRKALYYQDNKDKIIKGVVQYQKKRRTTDSSFRMIRNLRRGLNHSLKGMRKPKKTMELLGCTREHLRQHLAAQFAEGMTLENYGKWHIDHIQPVANFDHNDPEQVAICWHYTNMQPMWAKDNIRKSNKVIAEHQVSLL